MNKSHTNNNKKNTIKTVLEKKFKYDNVAYISVPFSSRAPATNALISIHIVPWRPGPMFFYGGSDLTLEWQYQLFFYAARLLRVSSITKVSWRHVLTHLRSETRGDASLKELVSTISELGDDFLTIPVIFSPPPPFQSGLLGTSWNRWTDVILIQFTNTKKKTFPPSHQVAALSSYQELINVFWK